MSDRRTNPTTHALRAAGEFLDKHDVDTDAATAIQAVTRALEEGRPVADVLKEEVLEE